MTDRTPRPIAGLSLRDKRRIDSVCDRFEQDWLDGEPGSFSLYLDDCPETIRLDVLCELLLLDFEYRERDGQQPSIDYYREQGTIPEELLQRVFALESTITQPTPTPIVPFAFGSEATATRDELPPAWTKADNSLPPGTRIDGYEILEVLGRGGMGVVYKAKQLGIDRPVALKMLLHARHASSEELVRFRREALTLGQLSHPRIVNVYNVGRHDGVPYISLEYVAGGSLDRQIQGVSFPALESARFVEELATTLHVAHEAGIVHRDTKPANILLEPRQPDRSPEPPSASPSLDEWSPKITDFGLAKNLGDEGQTESGVVLGTPSYMAPEQARGDVRSVDRRTDIYALGAILYQLLTGRPPFKGPTTMETVLQVLEQDVVPPRRIDSSIPLDLQRICLKCLAKNPDDRYQEASALADDLHRFGEGLPVSITSESLARRSVRWVKRRPLAVLAALAATLLLLVGGVVIHNMSKRIDEKDQEIRRTQAELERIRKIYDRLPEEQKGGVRLFARWVWADPKRKNMPFREAVKLYMAQNPDAPAIPVDVFAAAPEQGSAAAASYNPKMFGD